MDAFLRFLHTVNPLVLGIGGLGVGLILLVIIINRVQVRRAQANAVEAGVEHVPLESLDSRTHGPQSRVEPSMRASMPIEPATPAAEKSFAPDATQEQRAPSHVLHSRLSGEDQHDADTFRPPTEDETVDIDIGEPVARASDTPHAPLTQPAMIGPREPTAPIDGRVNSIVKLRFAAPLAADRAAAITDRVASAFKKSQAWMWSATLGAWVTARAQGTNAPAADVIAFSMPLATRSGAVTESQLRDWMTHIAESGQPFAAEVVYAPIHEDAKRAVELDQFCGNLDLVAGVSLMRPDRSAIPGTRIRGTLEAEGFRLTPEGHFVLMSDDGVSPIYDIKSTHGQPLSVEALRHEGVHGLALTLDVMRVANPVQQFDLMRSLAKRLSLRLEATVVDDRGHTLTDAMFTQIRSELEKRVTAARTAGIEPGSPLARTLFGD